MLAMPYSVVSVSGHMSVKGSGKFILDLGVNSATSTPDRETTDIPAAKTLHQQVQDGSILAHASKMTMTVRNLQTQIANIKRRMGLGSSSWSAEAEEALKTWLLRIGVFIHAWGPRHCAKMLMMTQTIEDLEGVVSPMGCGKA